jgi:alpha-tubulin suppressor-like RCC1 family protein
MFSGLSLLFSNQDQTTGSPSVYSWGLNSSGQLGIGSDISKGNPTLIEELKLSRIQSVHTTGHSNSSVALNDSGKVFTWGSGLDGVLGHEDTDSNLLIPTPVESLDKYSFIQVSCGIGHMAGLTRDGLVITWGLDDVGQCGHAEAKQDKNVTRYSPMAFKGGKKANAVEVSGGKKVVDVSCGRHFTGCVTEDGELHTWGNGRDYALGHGDRTNQKTPKKVEALADVKIVKVGCGRNFVVALDEKGDLYSWGSNDNGQLGLGTTDRIRQTPSKIRVLSKVVEIQAGDFHAIALTADGKVYTWGAGGDGQLGHGNTNNQNTPRQIPDIPLIARISAGGGHTALITQDFKLWIFGRGRDGQLGREGNIEAVASYRTRPVLVDFLKSSRVLQVSCGMHHTLALADP